MDKIIILCDHNIGYMLSEYLLKNNKTTYEILKIYTNSNNNQWWRPVIDLKEKYNFELNYFNNNTQFYDENKTSDIDYILLLSWKHIMSKENIRLPKKGMINLHYSLLPQHRGAYPVNWSIMNGDTETGISYHFVDDNIDAGTIIKQEKVLIDPWETATDLLNKLDDAALALFKAIWGIRTQWGKICFDQKSSLCSYHSKVDFVKTNQIDLNRQYKAKDFIDLLRGKSFDPYSKNTYFIDEKTGKKIFISVNLSIEE